MFRTIGDYLAAAALIVSLGGCAQLGLGHDPDRATGTITTSSGVVRDQWGNVVSVTAEKP